LSKIDPSADLINLLRAQLIARTGAKKSVTASEAAKSESAATRPEVVPPQEVKRRIGQQIKDFDLRTEAGRKYARRIFLESVIAWDLGDRLLGDGRFSFIIKDVDEALSSDKNVSDAFDHLLEDIQTAAK